MTEHPLQAIVRLSSTFRSFAAVASEQFDGEAPPEMCRMIAAAMREAADAVDAYAASREQEEAA